MPADLNRELIICRDIHNISKIKPKPDIHYIVASDDIEVHNITTQYPFIKEICWIEEMQSFFNVAEDVKAIVDIINEWLTSLSTPRTIPSELLFWIKHAEGGLTTQRIQDALLLIDSYLNLIEKTQASTITIITSFGWVWEDEVLIKTADGLDIPVTIIGKRHRDIKLFIKLFLREPYYITKFLQSKYSVVRKTKANDKEIVFQLCTSEAKHLAHTIPLMKSLQCAGYNPVALCWASHDCPMKLKDIGFEAEHLEKYGTLSSIISGEFKLINTWRIAKNRKSALMEKLQYKNVHLGPLLWPSIQFFFSNSVAQRYRLRTAIKKYYTQHNPAAIRFWTMSFPEGTIPFNNLPPSHKPLIFGNTGFHDLLNNPYNDKKDILALDLKLVTGHRQKVKDERHTLPKNKITAIGHVSFEHYEDPVTKEASLKELSIPSNYSNYIIYDSGTILRGFLTIQEQIKTLTALLNFVKGQPTTALLIKPHPNHKVGFLEAVVASYGLKNVYLIDKGLSMHHCLNASDILITKWSTSGIEAMYLKTPVISVCLDKEQRFRIYNNAAEYAYSIDEFNELLHKAFLPEWRDELNNKTDAFLKDNFYIPTDSTPSRLGAEEIISMIENRSTL